MKLEPLEQWICDACGELIKKPSDGWIEWISNGDPRRVEAFRIVHHAVASPRGPSGCYRFAASGSPDEHHSHLDHMLGVSGMYQMTRILEDASSVDLPNWTETFRRLFLPYYEEARLSWKPEEGEPADCLLHSTGTKITGLAEETLRRIAVHRKEVEDPDR